MRSILGARSFLGPLAPLFASSVLVLGTGPAAAAPRVLFTSPVSGARWVRPETSLLLRFDTALDAAPAIAVTGARSGTHTGRVILADGGRALIFRSAQPFAYDESVTVTVDAARADGSALAPLRFTTSRAPATVPAAARMPDSFTEDPAAPLLARATLPSRSATATGGTPFALPPTRQTRLDESAGGVLFLAPLALGNTQAPYLLIQDSTGVILFQRNMPAPCYDFKLQPDGRMSYFDSNKWQFTILDNNYEPVDSFVTGNGYLTDVHELRILPNGHAILLGTDAQTVDMSQIVPGGNPAATVLGNVIQELDQDKNVVFEWRTFDHFQITDATHEDLTAPVIDAVHANALDLDNDGNILLSSRHLDEITKIDHATGDILWRMGGKHNQFTLLNQAEWFSHQHAIRRIANGHVTLFDNGNFRVPQFSRALELSLDETNKVATNVWEFDNAPEYAFAMGYVERLDDGSTLVSFGTAAPAMVQARPDGSVSQVLNLPPSQVSYRVLRQAFLPVAAAGNPAPTALALSNAIPSPFRASTSLFVTLAHPSPVGLEVFDVNGRRVFAHDGGELQAPGVLRLPVDLATSPAGIYFARVTTNAGTATRRLVRLP